MFVFVFAGPSSDINTGDNFTATQQHVPASAAVANVTEIVIPAAVESQCHVTEPALLAAQPSEPVHILSHLRL